jgi:tRNA(Ile)-lysidine synthase
MFQEERVPLWERRHWPVLTCQSEIVWSRRFGPAAILAAGTGCFPVLRITETL